jgi:hypothetical protein
MTIDGMNDKNKSIRPLQPESMIAHRFIMPELSNPSERSSDSQKATYRFMGDARTFGINGTAMLSACLLQLLSANTDDSKLGDPFAEHAVWSACKVSVGGPVYADWIETSVVGDEAYSQGVLCMRSGTNSGLSRPMQLLGTPESRLRRVRGLPNEEASACCQDETETLSDGVKRENGKSSTGTIIALRRSARVAARIQ